MNILQSLQQRRLIKDCSDIKNFTEKVENNHVFTVYAGFDLTADSLHVGNLAVLMQMRLFMQHGHKIIAVIGGATTKIGDPSGKDETRKVMHKDTILTNKLGIIESIMRILLPNEKYDLSLESEVIFQAEQLTIIDNDYWFKNINYIDFLRDIGTHFTVNRMLAMESVKNRLDRMQSMSFIEFNYMLLQAYDFLYLHEKYGCDVQIGGSDQWGNMINGVDLIGKVAPRSKVFALTFPLVTRSDGKKMGKSENGAIWLNSTKLSDFEYFQYFRNIPDADVATFTNIFTDSVAFEGGDINKLKEVLAFEATKICRGELAGQTALGSAVKMFADGELDIENALLLPQQNILDLVLAAKFATSKGEVRRLIEGGGVKINGEAVKDVTFLVTNAGVNGEYFLLSVGKKNKITIKLI
jgi:tyrosyl-tRNA synthetase